MAGRGFYRVPVLCLYVVVFWAVLPAAIILPSLLLDRRLGLSFHPGDLLTLCSWSALLISFALLLCAVAQYRRQAGEWPISAFPSRRFAQNGLYRIWRHPIYLFFTFSLFFSAILLGSGSMLILVLPVFVAVMAWYSNREEHSLIMRFGSCAFGYKRRTGAFIPRLQMLMRIPLAVLTRTFLRVLVQGRSQVPLEGPLFVVASHRCYLDPLFMAVAVRRHISFVATSQLFRSRLCSKFFRYLGCIPRRRYMKDTGCIRTMIREVEECGVIGFFPEGERSWTGEMGPLKEESIRFFLRFRDVPILPLRIEGNYAIWPRWRRFPSPGRVRITVLPGFKPSTDDTLQTLSSKLSKHLQPDDSGLETRSPSSCTGIGRVLYRCPACLESLPLFDNAVSSFKCHSCGTVFALDGSLRLNFSRGDELLKLSISKAYNQIRVKGLDHENPMLLEKRDMSFRPMMPAEQTFAGCSDVIVTQERPDGSLEEIGRGQVLLTSHRLILPGDPRQWIPFEGITSVTTEGCRWLQLYDSCSRRLYQLNFMKHSVLLWQNLLVLAIEASTGRTPNRS